MSWGRVAMMAMVKTGMKIGVPMWRMPLEYGASRLKERVQGKK